MKIEDQMALQRVLDLARDRSVHLKKNELVHDFMAHMGKEQAKREQQQVQNLEAKGEIRIQKQSERDVDYAQDGGKKRKRKRKDEAPLAPEPDPPTIVVETYFPDDMPGGSSIDLEI